MSSYPFLIQYQEAESAKLDTELDTMAWVKWCWFENEQKLKMAKNIEDLINIKISTLE